MASGDEKQPLLPALEDPTPRPNKKNVAKYRYRRCRSAPMDFILPEKIDSTQSKSIFVKLHPSFKQVVLFLALYLGVGTLCFYLVEDQIRGMALVGLILSNAADYIVEKQEVLLAKALHKKAGGSKILKEIENNRVKYKIIMIVILLVVLITTGTIVLSRVENLDLIDAFYCVCSTITTLGYGDKSFSTDAGRIFAVFWILTSTICVAQFFLYLAELNTEHRQHLLVKWVLKRKMTYVDLEAADMDDDGVVSAAEFIVYKLREMGKITQEDIGLVMEEFEELDVDQSGTLSGSDIKLAQSSQKEA